MLTKADSRLIHALKTRRGREKHGFFVVEGVRVVEDLLASGIDLEFAVAAPSLVDNERGSALRERLAAATSLREVDERTFAEVTDTETPQGVIAVARIPQKALDDVQFGERATVLVLDAIQDPGNLGTLIRTADAFAVAAVIALPGTTDFWSPKVIRSTAGAAFRLPLINAPDADAWRWLTEHKAAICGADMHGEAIGELAMRTRAALVVGNEGGGLRPATRDKLTHLVSIPMRGDAESLNVAIAAGILLYELTRGT